ncbi:CCA tRNA nucleotidyltransferase [Floricoccus penangensis]|uniref:CCA-adding enzyme n=1 Tax=Floricoccus penangensis TaxID=1859475 RepID=A0A9Q5P102_9LACT|nr:CCA tRNA nucleotidyltransferase [Floricoccus penangensis]OFI46914.1 CCA tRNA nucleotidyltransferase [Floricoccus penangensis]
MRLENMPVEFQQALPLINTLKEAGYEAYFVGGSVRDVLLKRRIHDVDIATSAYPEEVKAIFEKTIDIGIEHGTVLVLAEDSQYEITTFRTEDVYVDYRRPSGVTFVRRLEEDLLRRDFTINAFALAEDGQIIDKFDGLTDLENKLIRAVGVADERFNEDALRIMRALRFSASLDFDIEEKTFEAMKVHAPLLEKISIERSFIELDKLLTSDYWRKGLRNFIDSKVYNHLTGLVGKEAQLENILKNIKSDYFWFTTSEQAWAYLLINLEVENCKDFLKKWNVSNEFTKKVTNIYEAYKIALERVWEVKDLYKYGFDAFMYAEGLLEAEERDIDTSLLPQLTMKLPIKSKSELNINGQVLMNHFNRQGGIWIGQLISEVEELVVNGQLENNQEAILEYVEKELKEE